jgi:hypothetical protein
VRPGTVFVSQPAPGASDLPNDPALGVVNLSTGVVTHLNTPFASPKGLLFIPADHQGSNDGLSNAQDALDEALSQVQDAINQATDLGLPPELGLPPGFGF